MTVYGIKASVPNVSVQDATDDQLTLDSSQRNIKKTTDIGVISQELDTMEDRTVTYHHGRSTIPTFRVFFDVSDGLWREVYETSAFLDNLPEIFCSAAADEEDISIYLFNVTETTQTIRIKIFIFVDGITI